MEMVFFLGKVTFYLDDFFCPFGLHLPFDVIMTLDNIYPDI